MMRDQADSLRRQMTETRSPLLDARQAAPRARKIAVTSGKGGVGKSNVSLNMAIALGRLGQKVLLIDADTNLANIDILLGVHVKYTLADVIFGGKYFADILVNGPDGIKILPGSSGVVEMVEKDDVVRQKLSSAFDEFERVFDIILIDTGAGLSEPIIQFVAGADDVVLVTNAEPTSITDAYAMVKVSMHRNPSLKMHVLVNLASSPGMGKETFEKLYLAVRNFLHFELIYLGHLPLDPSIPAAVARREPFLSAFPRSAATTSMVMMARKLLKLSTRSEVSGNLLTRILQRKGE